MPMKNETSDKKSLSNPDDASARRARDFMPTFFAGELRAVPASEAGDGRVWLTGEPVGKLVAASAAPRLSTALLNTREAEPAERSVQPSLKKARRAPRSTNLTYYACTRLGCGWSGSKPSLHATSRPKCMSAYPCTVNYQMGTSAKAAVHAFVTRCTARQRELGLPPDFAKPVPMVGRSGVVDHSTLYLTVPEGKAPGDIFEVSLGGNGLVRNVTVPPGRAAGDMISISASGPMRATAR